MSRVCIVRKTVCMCSALPYVRQYDRPKNVIEGDPFQTECYAWGYPRVTVVWHHGAEAVVAEASRVMLKNGSAENSTLRLEDVTYDDSAQYTCVATNALGAANATISLHVKGTEIYHYGYCTWSSLIQPSASLFVAYSRVAV